MFAINFTGPLISCLSTALSLVPCSHQSGFVLYYGMTSIAPCHSDEISNFKSLSTDRMLTLHKYLSVSVELIYSMTAHIHVYLPGTFSDTSTSLSLTRSVGIMCPVLAVYSYHNAYFTASTFTVVGLI